MYSGQLVNTGIRQSFKNSFREQSRRTIGSQTNCSITFQMTDKKRFRVFATSRIGDPAENRFREHGYELEVFQGPEAPPKKLIIEKVKSGIDGLITTLRDPIDAEVFEAGKGTLKVVAQIAVGFDNINRADANKYKIPFTNTADVLTEATAEFAFFMMGMLARKMWRSERLVREQKWPSWHPFLPFLGDEVTGKTIADHRHRTDRPGDDQEMLRLRHEHPLLRSGIS